MLIRILWRVVPSWTSFMAVIVVASIASGQVGDERTRKGPLFAPEEVAAINRDYQESIAKLKSIVGRPIPQAEQAARIRFLTEDATAIWVLGQLKAVETAELIMPYLAQHRVATNFGDDDDLLGFTAATALAKMGSLAVPHLLKRLEGECSELEMRLIGVILFRIDGQDLGRLRLQLDLEKTQTLSKASKPSDRYLKNLEDLYSRFNTPGYLENGLNSPQAELARIIDARYPPKKTDQ